MKNIQKAKRKGQEKSLGSGNEQEIDGDARGQLALIFGVTKNSAPSA